MSGGFLRRMAGAFVEFPDDDRKGNRSDLDAITNDAAELLAQLEHHEAPRQSPSSSGGDSPDRAASGSDGGGGFGAPTSVMGMNADDVFCAAGIPDGPNSAERILKILAGLTMFPPEQQLVMVRAMDQADSSWSEPLVLEDARARQAALNTHLQRVEGERRQRLEQLQQRIGGTRAEGKSLCDDIDARIAQLQAQREEVVVQTTAAVAELEAHIGALEADADRARRGITHVIGALSRLMPFFGAEPGDPHGSQ